jgi:hypothetical protein
MHERFDRVVTVDGQEGGLVQRWMAVHAVSCDDVCDDVITITK